MSCASWQLHWRNAQQSDEHVDSSGLVMYYRDSGYNGAASATYHPLYPTNGSATATYRPLSATTAMLMAAVHLLALISVAKLN